MEIKKYNDIIGVVVNEDIVEGRMVLMTTNVPGTYDFGSRGDLPGVKLPDTSAEAGVAWFMVGFAVDNRSTPIYQPSPGWTFALRGGWDKAENLPLTSTTVHLTHPGNKLNQTIPSGSLALAFHGGTFKVSSGHYLYNAALETPGARMNVADTASDSAADAGKLKYNAAGTVAIVERYHSDTGDLEVRLLTQ